MRRFNPGNFYCGTTAEWTSCPRPVRHPDHMSGSGSDYWYGESGVVRYSDHWGSEVASCDWYLDGVARCSFDDHYGTAQGRGAGHALVLTRLQPARRPARLILERPTRAERRAMKRATIAQGAGRVTMRMPVSEEVAAAFEHGRAGQHRPWRRRNRPQGHDHVPDGRGPQSRTQTILCGQRHENGRDHQPSHRTMASNQMNIRFYINKYSATFSVYLA